MKRFTALCVVLLLVTANVFAQSTAYSNQLLLAQDANFLGRVKIAIIKAAIAIRNESTGTTGHAGRTAFASSVLASPDGMALVMAKGIVTQSPVSVSITVSTSGGVSAATTTVLDSDIDTIVSALWNAYSPGALP